MTPKAAFRSLAQRLPAAGMLPQLHGWATPVSKRLLESGADQALPSRVKHLRGFIEIRTEKRGANEYAVSLNPGTAVVSQGSKRQRSFAGGDGFWWRCDGSAKISNSHAF